MWGTLINAATVITGSLIGLGLHARLPQRLTRTVFQAIGLFTLLLGFTMAIKTSQILILIFSVLIGSVSGELLALEDGLNRLGEILKNRLKSGEIRFSEGLVTAFLLFCMGSMTILGAFEEGLGGKPNLLLAKAVLDGFSSLALAAGLGVGVLFAVVPLILFQGGLTLLARLLGEVLTVPVINEMTAVGGLLLIGLGLNILEIQTIRVINMLPALLVAIGLAILML